MGMWGGGGGGRGGLNEERDKCHNNVGSREAESGLKENSVQTFLLKVIICGSTTWTSFNGVEQSIALHGSC